MTCPTTACFDGWPDGDKSVPMGKSLRYFGDGFQASKVIAGERFWRIPVLSGEFLVADTAGVGRGVGGGNLIIGGRDEPAALAAATAAVEAMRGDGIALPFPAGSSARGSKVGALNSEGAAGLDQPPAGARRSAPRSTTRSSPTTSTRSSRS